MKLANILTTPLDENDADDSFDAMYQIRDIHTKQSVGKPSDNRRRLRRKADKLDNEYGAVRYIVVKIRDDITEISRRDLMRGAGAAAAGAAALGVTGAAAADTRKGCRIEMSGGTSVTRGEWFEIANIHGYEPNVNRELAEELIKHLKIKWAYHSIKRNYRIVGC